MNNDILKMEIEARIQSLKNNTKDNIKNLIEGLKRELELIEKSEGNNMLYRPTNPEGIIQGRAVQIDSNCQKIGILVDILKKLDPIK